MLDGRGRPRAREPRAAGCARGRRAACATRCWPAARAPRAELGAASRPRRQLAPRACRRGRSYRLTATARPPATARSAPRAARPRAEVAVHPPRQLAPDRQAEAEPALVRARAPRAKRSKIRSRSCGGTPGPPSATTTCAIPSCVSAARGSRRRAAPCSERVVEQDARRSARRCRGRRPPRPAVARRRPRSPGRARRRAPEAPRRPSAARRRARRARCAAGCRRRCGSGRAARPPGRDSRCTCASALRGLRPGALDGRRARARRSASSMSSITLSDASGVRSSCDAVATNARRACSCSRRRDCIVANARLRSPISSRPRSRLELGVRAHLGDAQGRVAQAAGCAARCRPASSSPTSSAPASPASAASGERAAHDAAGLLRVADGLARGDDHAALVDRQRERDLGLGARAAACRRSPLRLAATARLPPSVVNASALSGSVLTSTVPSRASTLTSAPLWRASSRATRSSRGLPGRRLVRERGERAALVAQRQGEARQRVVAQPRARAARAG